LKSLNIVVTGGGTGGHVYPGLVVAQALKLHRVVYVGSKRGLEKKVTETYNIPFRAIISRPLVGQGILKKVIGLLFMGIGFLQSFWFFLWFRPRVVLGTGGYVSSPVLLAAVALRIPSLLLEQNVLPGRTTRLLSRFVSRVLVSFGESKRFLPRAEIRVTGNPVRQEIGGMSKEEGCKKLGLSSEIPVIGVMGASQGARAINQALLQALPRMRDKAWQIVHLTGQTHYAMVLEESKKSLSGAILRYLPLPFLEEMAFFYAASDLIVARAGATSMAEIMLAGKPSILIPYPHAADNHQEMNARWLEERGGSILLLETALSAGSLIQEVERLITNPAKRIEMGETAKKAAPPNPLQSILANIEDVVGVPV